MMPYNPRKKDLAFMILAFIPMWYIHSMVEVNSVPDLHNYEDMFYRVRYMTLWESVKYEGSMEAGYVLLNKMVSLITNDYHVFQGLYSFAMLFLYFSSFRKYSPYAILSVIILLAGTYNISIYVIRQYLAVAIFVASIPLILERKLYLYLLVCGLNFFIHKTSIICIPVYFIYQLKPYLIFASSTAIALLIFFGADAVAMMMVESLEDYQKYLVGDQGGQNWVGSAIRAMELGVFVFIFKKRMWTDDILKLLLILLILVFLVNVATIGKVGTVSRMASYYDIASLFALPYMLKEIKVIPIKVAVFLLIMFLKVYPTFFGSSSLSDLADIKIIS